MARSISTNFQQHRQITDSEKRPSLYIKQMRKTDSLLGISNKGRKRRERKRERREKVSMGYKHKALVKYLVKDIRVFVSFCLGILWNLDMLETLHARLLLEVGSV